MKVIQDMKLFLKVQGAFVLLPAMFCYGIGAGILAPMNAVYLREGIGLSKGQIVTVFAVSLLLNMIITLAVGLISDKLRRKKPLLMSAALICLVGLGFYMQAHSFATALTGMVIAVAPSGLIMGQLFAMARNHYQRLLPDIMEIAQLWLRATYSVGFFTGLLLGANLYLLFTFKGVLWGNLFGYAMLVSLLLFYKEADVEAGKSAQRGEPFSLLMLTALLLLACGDALRGLYLPLVVVETFGKPDLMSYLWSTQAGFELLFMTLAGYWAERFGAKPVFIFGSVLALIVYTTYALQPPLPFYFAVQPLYSFYVSVLYGVAMGYVQRMFVSRIGFGSSLYVLLTQTASLTGYLLPLFIKGFTPKLFFIPGLLVAASLVLMLRVWMKDRTLAAKTSAAREG